MLKYALFIVVFLTAFQSGTAQPSRRDCEDIYARAYILFKNGKYQLAAYKLDSYKICAPDSSRKADLLLALIAKKLVKQDLDAKNSETNRLIYRSISTDIQNKYDVLDTAYKAYEINKNMLSLTNFRNVFSDFPLLYGKKLEPGFKNIHGSNRILWINRGYIYLFTSGVSQSGFCKISLATGRCVNFTRILGDYAKVAGRSVFFWQPGSTSFACYTIDSANQSFVKKEYRSYLAENRQEEESYKTEPKYIDADDWVRASLTNQKLRLEYTVNGEKFTGTYADSILLKKIRYAKVFYQDNSFFVIGELNHNPDDAAAFVLFTFDQRLRGLPIQYFTVSNSGPVGFSLAGVNSIYLLPANSDSGSKKIILLSLHTIFDACLEGGNCANGAYIQIPSIKDIVPCDANHYLLILSDQAVIAMESALQAEVGTYFKSILNFPVVTFYNLNDEYLVFLDTSYNLYVTTNDLLLHQSRWGMEVFFGTDSDPGQIISYRKIEGRKFLSYPLKLAEKDHNK